MASSLPANPKSRMRRLALRGLAACALLGAVVFLAFRLSPWPGVLLIRFAFDRGSAAASAALEKHLPSGVEARLDLVYDAADPDARLDLFIPAAVAGTDQVLPTLVWIHGGGWVSGDENQIGNYARIVASRGFAVVSVNYTIAPEARYPEPLRQVNAALAFLDREGRALHVDSSRLFLAGDSAGSQISAQIATLVTSPDYAARMGITPALRPDQLRGLALFCGAYDLETVSLRGVFGWFVRTVLRAYFGDRDIKNHPAARTFSVAQHVTSDFPPAFITAGNADPLLPQSLAFAARLEQLGVTVDRLFFPEDHAPPLPHEYQFNLDTDAGRQALERLVAFLHARSGSAPGAPSPAAAPTPAAALAR
jgi:acetyl esterase/lipase